MVWVVLFSLLWATQGPGTARAEVVQDFGECGWFFQGKVPPKGFSKRNRVRICQRFKNRYHFATLYRTDLRIPVYSAYRYPCSLGEGGAYRPSPWFHEPQIDNQNAQSEMRSSTMAGSEKQATDEDYQDSGYDRGHLYPFSLNDRESATATCTLTNAVPKERGANIRWYQEAESVAKKLAQICHKSGRTMYLLTGSADPTKFKIKNRVSVPKSVWTALCCTFSQDQNNDHCLSGQVPSEGPEVLVYNRDFSFAFMKEMKPEQVTKHLTVRELQKKLQVSALFQSCRGTRENDEEQTFKEVEGLIEDKILNPVNNTGSSLLRPFGFKAITATLQFIRSSLLVPSGATVHTTLSGVLEIAKSIAPVLHGVAMVVGFVLISAFGILVNNP
ncbi:endonuclease domain-containing 1 protein-like [Pristis pectinata]|uniref:endonuclease domain-containing 1 protein-like n=1 Tax=Pristis pectinata TaxID=685728 RepID=UPI00223E48AF|nr:endonuclease domain-containing 1 protein-like [Pristis pectinata]